MTICVQDVQTPEALAAKPTYGAVPLRLHRADGPVRACFGYIRDVPFEHLDLWATVALAPAEAAAWRRCRTRSREMTYLSGRFAARQAVALYLSDVANRSFEIASGVFNQPIVHCPVDEPPAITISHTADVAVAIAHESGHVMGVDVEIAGAGGAALERFLSDAERRLARAIPGDEDRRLTAVWTMKEALSKALKCGLTVPLGVFEVSRVDPIPADGVRAEFSNFTQYKCLTWMLPRHVLSIVVPRRTELVFDPAVLSEPRGGQLTA
jgi:4'-phosphopantetheinyl transferase